MSEKPSNPDEVVDEKEQEASEVPEKEVKEATEEAEEEETEEQPSVQEEVAAEKAEEEETAEAAAEEEGEEEEIEIVEERIYTIPFRRVWATPRGKRTPRASRILRDFVRRHMKTEDVRISNEVNEELWARGIKKPPRQMKVRLVKDKEGKVIVYPATAA
ncbi:50S ribosomal protein L31e [[Eubacterium] cellulosolvens]